MTLISPQFERECRAWLSETVGGMTEAMERVTPSQFAEQNRYLPSSVTPFPGYLDFSVNPYMREIVDCFDIESPVREVNLRKGVQITYTTALESVMLYYMAHVKTVPMMYVTADAELAKARIENNITPMLHQSGLAGIIRSADEGNSRKTGKTDKHIQWIGGGYLVPFGANNASKMRSFSIMVMLKDELDGWPLTVGRDGDPDKLTDDRTAAYHHRRKILRGSTPLEAGSSKIDKQFMRGDQRYYHVRCLSCGFPQPIVWRGVHEETGREYGIRWEMDGGVLVPDSVRWCCANCGHGHQEHDKVKLFDDVDHGAHWKPTAKPVEPGIRSYHLPALYSPVGMQPWAKSVTEFLDAYDVERSKAKDIGKLQVFYNNVLAQSFELRGESVEFVKVSAHRRQAYGMGSIPNQYAIEHCGSSILMLVCTVDVHKSNLAVAIHGVARGRRLFLIDYWRFEGDGEDLECPDTWGRLRDLLETKTYTAADGKEYRISITLIDAGWSNDLVVTFCADYSAGVYPILGRNQAARNQTIKEFGQFTTQTGTIGYRVTVDLYKDRWSGRLNRRWSGEGMQPELFYNAPTDTTDDQLKELTVETKRERKDPRSGQRVGVEWHRPHGSKNELWDLLVYADAAIDMTAWDVCVRQLELDHVDWQKFWDLLQSEKLYYREPA